MIGTVGGRRDNEHALHGELSTRGHLPSKCEGMRLGSDSSTTSTMVHDTDRTLSYFTHFSRGQGRDAARGGGWK